MCGACLFIHRGFGCRFSLESTGQMVSQRNWWAVPGLVGVHWGGAWSASHPWSAVLLCPVGGVSRPSAEAAVFRCTIAAPRQQALYPTLLYPDMTVPDLTYPICPATLLCVSLSS
jgi:hypothetical protein